MSYFGFTCTHAKRYELSSSFCIQMSNCLAPFVWEPILSHWIALATLPETQVSTHLCTEDLSLTLVLALIAVSWNQVVLGLWFCFMKVILAILGPLHFHMNLRIDLSVATKKLVTILFGIAVNLDQSGENWHLDKYWAFRFINIYQVLVSLSCSVIFSVRVLHILCQIYPYTCNILMLLWIVLLSNFNSNYLLQYTETILFILYHVISLSPLNCSSSLVDSNTFSTSTVMQSMNRDSFTFSFPIWMLFIFPG